MYSYGTRHQNRRNFGTHSQVSVTQIYTNSFDFEESISFMKAKG